MKIFSKKLSKKPLKYPSYHKRCFLVGTVVLLALVWLNYAQSPVKGNTGETIKSASIMVDDKIENFFGEGFLGGPGSLNSVVIPEAQAAYDFTLDDEQENADFSILEGSGLISLDSPVPPSVNPFGTMRREASNYVVKEGDTPFDIAVKFGINTDTILWANSLRDGDLIRPGDKLTILPINGIRVKVVAKDSVESLAKKYGGKVNEIIDFNEIQDSSLAVGDFIIIPNGEQPTTVRPKVTAPKYATETVPVGDWLIAPASGYNWGRLHNNNGIDIASACGTPIYAAASGKVIISDGIGWNGGYGKYVEIKHSNGVVTLYAHSSQLLVSLGDEVSQGQLIATMGTTGRSTGCHVHFEVRGAKNPLAGKVRIIK